MSGFALSAGDLNAWSLRPSPFSLPSTPLFCLSRVVWPLLWRMLSRAAAAAAKLWQQDQWPLSVRSDGAAARGGGVPNSLPRTLLVRPHLARAIKFMLTVAAEATAAAAADKRFATFCRRRG